MAAHTQASGSWRDRLVAFLERRGHLIALLLGALVLFGGLGSTGLWEPWEMDRADLARTLASPPEAVAAFARDPATAHVAGPNEAALERAAAAEGVLVKAPEAGTPTALRAALDLARTRTVAAIVIDGKLLLPDAGRDDLWRQAGKLTAEAIDYAAGAAVVVVRDASQPAAAELALRLARERWRDVWEDAVATRSLAEVWDAGGVDAAATALAGEAQGPLVVLEPGDEAGLASAIADGASAIAARVAFKDAGRTITLPPLETWLRAAAYRLFGASEWTTRLPGALLAFIALWVLVGTVRLVWSPRVALFAGVIMATLPLFFAQARIISGEPAFALALTLVGCGLLLDASSRRAASAPGLGAPAPGTGPLPSTRLVWAYLAAGLVVAFLSKGTYALAVAGLVALVAPLVSGPSRRLADWVPAIVFLVAALLVELLAHRAAPGSLLSGLGFREALFSDGPSIYSRTFDMVIRQLGFGFAPWSPLVVVAVGLLVFSALERRDRAGVIVTAWFFLPIVALMASLGVGNQFLFPGAAAAAIAVALMLDKIARGESGPKYFIAFALVTMFYIMRRELKQSPEPLVGFLAYDPPFAKEGNLRFPETVEFYWVFKQSMILAALVCLVHFGAFARFAVRAARWLRSRRPFLITAGLTLLLGSLLMLAYIGRLHGIGMGSRFANSIGPAQKALVGRLVGADPMFIIGIATLVLAFMFIVFRWIVPAAGRSLVRLPDFATPARQRVAWAAAAFAWLAALVVVLARVSTPDDGYWSERLFSLPALCAVVAAGLTAWLALGARDEGRVRRWHVPALAALGVLALALTTQLARDANLKSPLVSLFVFLGWAAAALAIVPRIASRVEDFVFTVGAVIALVVMSFVVPLVDRGGFIIDIVLPGVALVPFLLSFWFIGPPLALVALLVNRALPDLVASLDRAGRDLPRRLSDLTDRLAVRLERGSVMVAVLLAVALVGVAAHLLRLEPAIAVNVSQKHILDTWRATAGEDAPVYKHGSFATQGRKDANFYTSGIPEIRDRQAALKVLLGHEDQVLEVETATGAQTLVFPGWSDRNDLDGDARRDAPALTGFITAVGDSVVTDANARWTPGSLVGKRLSDANGRTWNIVDNDATSVRVAPEERLSFALVPRSRAYYAIDDPRFEVGATAAAHERRALLLPADQLSDLNYAFRVISGGRHLPVLDGSSYRVLLTTSWLEEGEPQQNRLALATFDDKRFAALDDPRLVRVWGNFDDTIQVVGYATDKNTVSTGEMLKLSVYYKTLKLVKKSLKIFVHMDKSGGGARIAGDHWPLNPTRHTEDNKNCGGCYRTDHWLVGDIVRDDYDIEIPEGNTGEYTIWIGLYQPGPDTRLPVKSFDQKRARHDGQNRLGLGTVQVK